MMRLRKKCLVIVIMLMPFAGFSQDTLYNKPDSTYDANTRINFNNYFTLLGADLIDGFSKPFHMKKRDWGNFGKFAVVAVALSFADEPVQKATLKLREHHPGLNSISKVVTDFGGKYEVYTLAALGAYGLFFKNAKLKNTTLLATQAYITGGAIESVLKFISGRTRPSWYAPGIEAEPRFLGPFSTSLRDADGKKENSSFPSGHTTVAFAAATVFASEYKEVPFVPIIAYGAASLIGISRITENKHWTTDVLVGAALGFLSGKQAVKNYHRFAGSKENKQKKNGVSFNLNYSFGHWEPGIVYSFN